jgi:hypothetical protein
VIALYTLLKTVGRLVSGMLGDLSPVAIGIDIWQAKAKLGRGCPGIARSRLETLRCGDLPMEVKHLVEIAKDMAST